MDNFDVESTKMLLTSKKEINDEPPKSKKDIHLELMLQEAYSKKNIEMKTELTAKQVSVFAKGRLYARTFNCSILNDLIEDTMVLLVSKGRAGRKEWTQMAKSYGDDPIDMGGIRSRLLGG